MAGAVLLVSTSVACDMQQDRSTGWRLGTPRVLQFRYQVLGILVGAVLAVVFARLFMAAYPVLLLDQTVMKAGQQPAEWSFGHDVQVRGRAAQPDRRQAVPAHGHRRGRRAGAGDRGAAQVAAAAQPSCVDAILLPSPYALSFGGFVNLPTSLWFGAGGVVASLLASRAPQATATCRRT